VLVAQQAVKLNGNNMATTELKLPGALESAVLNAVIKFGALTDGTAHPLQILQDDIEFWFYPATLLLNAENVVFFESFVPRTVHPASFVAAVVDDDGIELTKTETRHFGRGNFVLTPKAGVDYYLDVENVGAFKIPV
jgi:hypothetical protein